MSVAEPLASKRIEYTTHDFSVLNRHVEEGVLRTAQLRSERRAEIFQRYCTYAAVGACGLGVLALLAGAGYWLAFAPPKPETKIVEVEKPLVVKEPYVVKEQVVVPTSAPTPDPEVERLRREVEALRAARESVPPLPSLPATPSVVGSPVTPEKVVRNYTLFTHVDYGVDGIIQVVTGANFTDSSSTYPTYQYCYVELPIERGKRGALKTVHIASKSGRNAADTSIVDRVTAEAAGTTIGVLRAAQGRCRFI